MTRVMAQGTFDILHPGHLHYLRESRALGDELVVVIARDERLTDEKDLYFSDEERRDIVESIDVVDEARRGTTGDPFEILDDLEPNIVTIGHDQPYDLDRLEVEFEKRSHGDISTVRIDAYEPAAGELVSSSEIKARLKERHGEAVFYSLKN